jgi:hypothetical protein
MRRDLTKIGYDFLALGICSLVLIGLVYKEGWIWPLQIAGVLIPAAAVLKVFEKS